jgi:hypothetical protein
MFPGRLRVRHGERIFQENAVLECQNAYSELKARSDNSLTMTFTVKNTGSRAGEETLSVSTQVRIYGRLFPASIRFGPADPRVTCR